MAESHQDRRDRDQAELVELRNRLREDVEGLAVDLLGEPSSRSGAELRFGRQGSLSVVIGRSKRGTWFSHEAGEGGDLLGLIRHARACSFPDALDFARRWVGMPEAERSTARRSAKRYKPEPANDTDDTAEKRRLAVLLAGMVRPIAGTPAARYLAGRGIAALPCRRWGGSLPCRLPIIRRCATVATLAGCPSSCGTMNSSAAWWRWRPMRAGCLVRFSGRF